MHDHEMWMRVALYWDIAFLATPLVTYRLHDGNYGKIHMSPLNDLKQHYNAWNFLFENHKEKIGDIRILKKQVSRNTMRELLRVALQPNVDERACLDFALTFMPGPKAYSLFLFNKTYKRSKVAIKKFLKALSRTFRIGHF